MVMELMIMTRMRDKRHYFPQPIVFRGTKSLGPSLSLFQEPQAILISILYSFLYRY